jgi:shikimate kinase
VFWVTNRVGDQCVPLIFLVGFMGSGKTSVGGALSRRLGWGFEDLDQTIELREGRSIADIFREWGEGEFRRAEEAALRAVLQRFQSGAMVIALGGGTFVQPQNAALLAASGGKTIFLDAGIDELWRRCQENSERPLGSDEQHFRHLYATRHPAYMKASIRVDTGGKDVESVAEEIIKVLGLKRKHSDGQEK